jgi:hypothetical protein
MDPYLESPDVWSDFHLTMTIAMRAELNTHLPPRYAAAADRYVWIHEPEAIARTRVVRPDVFVAERSSASAGRGATVSAAAPAMVVFPAYKREGNKYLKIVDVQSRRVVTVIELLSPANKQGGDDREAYLTKRVDYLAAGVNLVEIDLLRTGEQLPFGSPAPPQADYYVLVCSSCEMPQAGVWPVRVRESLPEVPVPLLPEDGPIHLSLQKCMNRTYDEGRYALQVDYDKPPDPPLNPADVDWAAALLKNFGRV